MLLTLWVLYKEQIRSSEITSGAFPSKFTLPSVLCCVVLNLFVIHSVNSQYM